MRSINSTILAQLEANELRPFYLLDIEIEGTHYRYTDCDVPVILRQIGWDAGIVWAVGIGWEEDKGPYDPRPFTFDPVTYSAGTIVSRARIRIDNLDSTFTALFVGSTVQGSNVDLDLIVVDTNGTILGPATVKIFEGIIDSWQLDETQVTIDVTSILNRWTQKTIMLHPSSCRWKKFKGTECGYTGTATWCDRSYARCSALGNTANFGGNRWLPSIVDKELWWGRTRK